MQATHQSRSRGSARRTPPLRYASGTGWSRPSSLPTPAAVSRASAPEVPQRLKPHPEGGFSCSAKALLHPKSKPALHLFQAPVNYVTFSDRKNIMLTRRLPHLLLGFILLFCLADRAIIAQTASPARPTIVFMTDFGVVDDSVALCKGVMYSIAPELRIVDLADVDPRLALETWLVDLRDRQQPADGHRCRRSGRSRPTAPWRNST